MSAENNAKQSVGAVKCELACNGVKQELNKVEEGLQGLFGNENSPVFETLKRLFASGGKRLRPALLLTCAKSFHCAGIRAVNLALAVELIHTASLIHDDIIDNDSIRRGEPTIHSSCGNQISVIVGDYLYSTAFAILAEDGDQKVIRQVASATRKMVRGNIMQLLSKNNLELSEEKYLSIIAEKTASLISCACCIGAMTGQGSNGQIEAMNRYGENLGMAFQITDDLLDLIGKDETLGKPPGSDIREGVLTLPLIFTHRAAESRDREWICSMLGSNQMDPSMLAKLKEMVIRYGGVEYALRKAEQYSSACIKEIRSLKDSESRKSLTTFVEYVAQRATCSCLS